MNYFTRITLNRFVKNSIFSFLLLMSSLSFGQIAISSSSPVTENFNGTVTAPPVNLPANWKMTPAGGGTNTWSDAANFTSANITANSGSPATGGRYNWGNGTTTTDRAIGFMTSGGYANPNSVMAFYSNTSGVQINDLTISFDYERYRINSAACSITFFTSTNGTTWTARTAGDSGAFTTGSSAYDFNTGTVINRSFTLSGINIPNGGNLYLRWNFNTTGGSSQGVGLDNVSLTATLNVPAITSQASGNWSNTATWAGGVIPTSADNAIIAASHVVTMDSGTYATRNAGTTTTVNVGGTLATSQTYVNNGTTTINGSFQLNSGGWVSDAGGTNALVYGSNGTLIFNTAYGANNGNYWPTTNGPVNVTVNTGSNLNLGFTRTITGTFQTAAGVTLTSSTLTLNGICQLNSGGFFNNSPTYGSSSTLVYNTSYGVFNEWTGNGAAGVGIPANVRVQTGTLTLTTSDRGISGNITIDATCSLVLNGTSGDLYIGGNWTNSGSFSPNGRAVFFNGASNQTITNTAGETFNYLVNNKSAGSLVLANNVTVNATAGSSLQLLNAGTIDLNGQALTLSNNGGNLQVTGGARSIFSAIAGGILNITGSKTVTSTSAGTLTLGANVTTILTNGINFGSGLTTIQGTLQVNSGGFVTTNSPVYANTSTLVYNNVTGYGVNNEWTGNATTAGAGTPQNVTLINSSVNLPNAARSLGGNLTLGTGGILNLNGTIGADLNIGGNWINIGTFNPNSRLVTFRGTSLQTLTGATTFDFLKIDNSSGLTLNNSIVNNLTLDLTAGNINLGANDVTIGTAGTVINAGAASYINTNGTGQFKRTVGASASLFPVGRSAYNPITFNNSGTSDVYGVRVADGALTTGLTNTKTVSRRWITSEQVAGGSNLSVVAQYNSGEENTGFIAATTPYIGYYNGSAWSQVGAVVAGSNPFTFTSSSNSTPSDLSTGTHYFALGKDNAFLSIATQFVVTTISPATPGAGYGFSVTVQSQDAFGSASNVVADTNFTLSTNGAAGSIGGTITGTILAGTNTVVVSGVTLSTAGTAATITSTQTSGDPLTAGTSATFNVVAAASQLAFIGVPATGNVGVNLASFTVEARRPDNSVDTFYTGNIVISKASGTGNLSGTLTVAAVAGVATFSAAQFDATSTYTLYADSGSFSQITSGNIVITLAPVSIFSNAITGTNPNAANPYTTGQAFNANITVSGVGRGTGINGSNANNRYNADGWSTAVSIDVNDYFEFTLTPNLGYYIDFNELLYTSQASGNGPTLFAVRSSVDGYTSNIAAPTSVGGTVSLTSTSFDTISSAISYRIYGYSAVLASGTFSVNDFNFTGNVVCIDPVAFTVTGGGTGCENTGVAVGLSGSQVGISYQLKNGATNVGSPVAGTGAAISFGNQVTAGTYTVEATNVACSLSLTMTGNATVTLTPIPTLDTITATSACINSPSSVTMTGLLPSTAGSFTYTNSFTGPVFYTVSGTSDASGNFSFDTPNLPAIANGAVITITSGTVTATGCTTTFTGKTVNVIVGKVTTWTGSSWDFGAPTDIDSAVISAAYSEAADIQACTLTVDTNAIVSIPSGFNITLNGAITVSSGSFTLGNNANLIQLTDVANSGNIVVKRNTKALKRLDYTLWSSPVAAQNLQSFSPGTLSTRFYTYTTSSNLYSEVASPSTTSFSVGTGYLIRLPNAFPTTPTIWPGSFTGVPNNGTYTVGLTNVAVGQRFNAIGNPYPSAIDLDEFVADNSTQITGTIYLWRKTNSTLTSPGYCTWTAGTYVTNGEAQTVPNDASFVDILSTGQGFIVEATATGSSVEFNNSQRVADNSNQFFRTENIERNRMWLNLTKTGGGFYQTAVGYITGATQGVDSFDGKYFNDGTMTLNSIINNEDYVIQGRSLPFDDTDVVPLSLTVATAGEYTISIDHLDGFFSGDQRIFLKDNTNNSLYDLKEASYTFTTAAGTFNTRFSIVYRNPRESNVLAATCGQTLSTLDENIYSNLVAGAQGYRFRVTNLATNQVQSIDRALRVFKLTQLANYAFAQNYQVEVAVKYNNVWQPFGNACTVTTPTPLTKVETQLCGGTLTGLSQVIYANQVGYAQGYRFRITNMTTSASVEIDRPLRDIRLSSVAGVETNTAYQFEVAVKNTDGTYLPYGEACIINSPINDTARSNDGSFQVEWKAVAYPNPFANDFTLSVTTSQTEQVQVKVYDMLGKLMTATSLEVDVQSELQLGSELASGVYNVIVTQGENVRSLRVIKR